MRLKAISDLDLMIAAQAVVAGVVLVTHHHVFRRVKGLKVEDWSKGWLQKGYRYSIEGTCATGEEKVGGAVEFGNKPTFVM